MKITDIKQQLRRADRYSIYIDGKYAFSLGELEILNTGIRLNMELTPVELNELRGRAEEDKAYDRVLGLLALRPRSSREVTDYLKRKKYEPETVTAILNKLSERGMINDLTFAQWWVEQRRALKAMSKRRLQQELRKKYISTEIINEVLGNDETDEQEVLKAVVAKKRQLARFQDDLKLMQYLSRQGYNYDDIKAVLHSDEEY